MTTNKKKPNRTKPKNPPKNRLTPEQGQRLRDRCEAYKKGIKDFIGDAYKVEMAQKTAPKKLDTQLGEFRRICAGTRSFSRRRRWAYAKVLGMSTEVLKTVLDAPPDAMVLSRALIPWLTDEAVVSKYRVVLHHYYIVRKNKDHYFWLYTLIDFREPQTGFLRAPIRYGEKAERNYEAFGYAYRKMLMLVFKPLESPDERESVHLFYNFREHDFKAKPFADSANFGVSFNQNLDGTQGFGGSLLFGEAFPGCGVPGRQEANVCDRLSNYWLFADGPRCNRLLSLFGHGLYKDPDNARDLLEAICNEQPWRDLVKETTPHSVQSTGLASRI